MSMHAVPHAHARRRAEERAPPVSVGDVRRERALQHGADAPRAVDGGPLAAPSTSDPYPAASHVSAMDEDPSRASGPATSRPMTPITTPLATTPNRLALW